MTEKDTDAQKDAMWQRIKDRADETRKNGTGGKHREKR